MELAQFVFCRQQRLDPPQLRARISELNESQFWPADRIEAMQHAALREALAHAAERVPYYRAQFQKLALRPDDAATPSGRTRVPVLSRDPLLQSPSPLHSDQADASLRWNSSGGSTGRPVRTAHDHAARLAIQAARTRALGWFDVRPWDRHGLLVSQHVGGLRLCAARVSDWLGGRVRNGGFDLGPIQAVDTARRLARLRPRYLVGMPSFTNRLIHFASAAGMQPRAWGCSVILSNTELLTPYMNDRFAEQFACPVLNEYGCTEVGSLAHRCPAGTLHLNPEHVLLELLDDEGRPVPAGTPGRVVVTALCNRAMPLIRYAVGDIAVRAERPCSCGRQPGYPGLLRVEGRQKQVWRDELGGIVSAVEAVGRAQERLARAGFWESQFVQRSAREIELRVHPNQPPPPDVLAEAAQHLAGPLGGPTALRWTGQPVERAPSGKTAAFLRDTEAR